MTSALSLLPRALPLARFLPILLLLGSAALLSGCASLTPPAFAHSPTHFELDRFFVGHNRSWGVFENLDGKPHQFFIADSYGRRAPGGDLILTQHFRFSTGKTQQRIWRIHRVDATHWNATANDMVGLAQGEGDGNAFYCEYDITLDRKNPLLTVHLRQWMYQPEGTSTLMTRLVITKLGFPISEVTESIHHVSP